MKAKRRIAWLLSFLMIFSLLMGMFPMQVRAEGGTANVTITSDVDVAIQFRSAEEKEGATIYSDPENTKYLFESGTVKEERKRIGCMIEQPALYPDMTARDNLIYYNKLMGIKGNSNIDEILELVGLAGTQKKKTKQFSLGMKQRLSIAIALLGYPDLLILDEPINGLDPTGIIEIRELILRLNREQNITIVISSHILGELSKIATRYGVIETGNLVEEFSKEELEQRCKTCIKIKVNDTNKAAYVLDNIIQSMDYKIVDEKTIYVYDQLEQKGNINEKLVQNDVVVEEINLAGQDLEAYFMELMGGKAHV